MRTTMDMHVPRTLSPAQARGLSEQTSLIRLGRVAHNGHELAAQAMRKLQRCGNSRIEAFVMHDGCGAAGLPAIEGCRRVATTEFAMLLAKHLAAGRLFTTTASEASCELPLYALASGVPLDAISLHRLPPDDVLADAMPRHGEIYLRAPLQVAH